MKKIYISFFVLLLFVSCILASPTTPINNGKLQSDLDANNNNIANLNTNTLGPKYATPQAVTTNIFNNLATPIGWILPATNPVVAGILITTNQTAGVITVVSGTNQKLSSCILSSGSVTVANTSVTANSVIFFAVKTISGTIGIHPYASTITAGTSFVVTATATDNSTYYYWIMELQ